MADNFGSIFTNNNITYASDDPPAMVELALNKITIGAGYVVRHVSGFNNTILYREIHPPPNRNSINFVGTCAPCWGSEETVIIAGESISQTYLVVPTSIQKAHLANQENNI